MPSLRAAPAMHVVECQPRRARQKAREVIRRGACLQSALSLSAAVVHRSLFCAIAWRGKELASEGKLVSLHGGGEVLSEMRYLYHFWGSIL